MADAATFAILIVPGTLLQGEFGPSFLDRACFRVRTAETAEEALRIARVWPPDLLVIGSSLEGGPPARVCARARQQAAAGLKVLLISESVDPSDGPGAGGADEALPDAHLVEPVDPDELLATVAALLDVSARRAPRVAVEFLASLSGVLEDGARPSVYVNVLSLSESGVRLESPCHLRLGATGALAFVLPGGGARLALQVRPRAVMDEIRLHYGVEFVDVAPADGTRLRSFVEARLGRSGAGEE
ncbi:MAG TPA: PilZ domain-containing protein [Polyangia bacterium]